MILWLGVENFGKIERARICINQYTLLVGPNNSGKSFLMQLADGINENIVHVLRQCDISNLLQEESDGYSEYKITPENSGFLIEQINIQLQREKENIVKNILGKDITIGKLYIEWEIDDSTEYDIYKFDLDKVEVDDVWDKLPGKDSVIEKYVKQFIVGNEKIFAILFKKDNILGSSEPRYLSHSGPSIGNIIIQHMIGKVIFSEESLYMPASRNGLLLLYRDFFANRVDHSVEFNVKLGEDSGTEADSALTKPIYKFLRFLQTYVSREKIDGNIQDAIAFYNEHVIEGKINVNDQGIFSYDSSNDELIVPMYLASSMINEVAPIYLALTSKKKYRRMIIDEVEASLHPQKQAEMVRLFNRLYNSGFQFIISTHSASIVTKINNLLRLSAIENRKRTDSVLKELGVNRRDIVEPEHFYAYEFVFLENGRSEVREMEFNESGFQFDLFTGEAFKIYNESRMIEELIRKNED